MKLSNYAKSLGVTYRTVWNWYKSGKLDAYQTDTGTIIVNTEFKKLDNNVAIYCRVSSSENKINLNSQKERLLNYCSAKGYKITKIITEIGSGVNDSRKQWLALLSDKSIKLIVVEHKDRFCRFGFNSYKILLNAMDRDIEVINEASNSKEDIIQDLISIITSFCSKIYGLRRSKRKTEAIIKELTNND